MTREEAERQFSDFLASSGFGEHHIPADAEWHNFSVPDKLDRETGSAKLVFGDHIEGVFKDWRAEKDLFVWKPGNGASANLTDEERQAYAAELDNKAKEKKAAREAARKKALNLYYPSPAATADHPYLLKKRIKDVGPLKADHGDLLVPVFNVRTDEFQTYQRIKSDGTKKFPKDAVKTGGYVLIGSSTTFTQREQRHGKKDDSLIVICEGYATGYPIRIANPRCTVVCAFDCNNLIVVAEALHARFPFRKIIIAADNDADPEKPDHNPGVRCATKAALAANGKIAVPPPGDFWDLWNKEGDAAVKKQIDKAAVPAVDEEEPPVDEEELPDHIGNSEDIEVEQNSVRPTIKVRNAAIGMTVDDTQSALIQVGVPIYERGGSLVHPVIRTVSASHDRQTKIAQLKKLDQGYLRYVLSKNTSWIKWSDRAKKDVRIDPPYEVANMLLSLNAAIWPFPTIKNVINTATMRPDGSILDKAGFDKATGLLLVGMPEMPLVPDRPTRDDALEAIKLFKDLLNEFPLVDGPSISTVLSGYITPVVRGAFPTSPIHMSRASMPGTGKSFIWDTVAAVSIGQPMMPVISIGPNMEELEKRLGAQLLLGQSQFSIDNLNGHLDSSALSQYVERPGIQSVHILGRTQNVELDLSGTTFFASGNNITVSPELARRKIAADLDANMENPGTRTFDKNPVAIILADRGRYVAAALTICRAYFVAGRPNKVRHLASFEGWSDVVRSALIWLGEADPVNISSDEIILSPERAGLAEMIDAWVDVIGLGPKYAIKIATLIELASRVTRDSAGFAKLSWPDLHAATQTIADEKRPDAKNVGRWLQANKGVIINDHKLMTSSNPKGGSKWWVQHKDFSEKPKPEHEAPGRYHPAHPDNNPATDDSTDATGHFRAGNGSDDDQAF